MKNPKNNTNPALNPSHEREQALFTLAAAKSVADRAAFLDRECGDDKALRARLDALLAAHEENERILAEPAPAAKATMKLEFAEVPDEVIGQKIGRYKILEKVGEGGCGVVYVAEQTEPVRRRVALKVIKLGMDTKAVVARFEAERQALAMMDHPNIAKVLDAGTTDTGRPYFIMELVRGIRITDYCDQNKLSTSERLDLFIKICQAIQHAHQKGIIHRDIKPSNILVTLHDGVPVPKVIDFGIAKATEGKLTDATVYTQLHQFIGTPAYMSPEQAEMSGLDIDTRSDIYSLGVLLYELLTGKTPFDAQELMSQGIDAMRKTIREKEPVRPSTKLATLKGEELTTTAKRRAVDSSRLASLLRGDLDWIVMKCLEKDRTRRYETANGLAFDLKRHLNNETVMARPPSSAYRFQKMVRRNKLAFAAVGAVLCAMVLGIVATTWQSVRATRAKQEALTAQASESIQRQKAEANEQTAIAAQANESKLREQAQAEELAARQRAYASDMNLAKQALDGHNLGLALDLLNRQQPGPGQEDLRGWEWRYLWQQTRSDALFALCREPSEIGTLAISPDGQFLAVGTVRQGGVSVWDTRTRQELFKLADDEDLFKAAFSPTEPVLAFAGISRTSQHRDTLHLFNTAVRRMITSLPLDGTCTGLAFSRDGQTLVTCSYDGHVSLWRVSDGTQLASYPSEQAFSGLHTGFAASPDLRFAAYGMEGGRLRVVDLRNGKDLWSVVATKNNTQYITALAFSPDGKILASGTGYSASEIRLWDAATGAQIGQLEGHGSWVTSLVFWPDGKKLASGSGDQTIRTWDVPGRKCLDVLRGSRSEVWKLALLPDDKTLVSGAKDGAVWVWDTSVTHPHQPYITIPAPNLAIWNFSSDGHSILILDHQGHLIQSAAGDSQQPSPVLDVPANFFSYCFSKDGRFLAVCWTNGVLQVWNTAQGILLHQMTNETGQVDARTFLANGRELITYSDRDSLLHQLDLATGHEIQSWPVPSDWWDILPTPDERSCLLVRDGGSILRNLTDGSQQQLPLDAPESDAGDFSPDGKHFAIGSSMGFGRVWDTTTWKQVVTLGNFLNGVHGVAFSPDGRRLAIAGHDLEAVRLCDSESWQAVMTLEGPSGIARPAFSPDGNTVAWGSLSSIVLWHAPSWDEINAAEAKEKAEIVKQ
jgi:WD40 repeat protein/tRNA A-37 threonylcarbamoyl transferase component Bud32